MNHDTPKGGYRYSKIPLLRSFKIKTTLLLRPAFANPNWVLNEETQSNRVFDFRDFVCLHMKRLHQTESRIFVIMCVLCFQRQSFLNFVS